MTSGINQYPNNIQYTNLQGNFNGGPNAVELQNTAGGQFAQAAQEMPMNPVDWVAPVGFGLAFCYGLEQAINRLAAPITGEKSYFHKFADKVDNLAGKRLDTFAQQNIAPHVSNIKNTIVNNVDNEIIESVKKGAQKETMLSPAPAKKLLIKEFTEEAEKLFKQAGKSELPEIKELLDKIKKDPANLGDDLIKEVGIQLGNSNVKEASTLRTAANKIKALNMAEGSSFLSKFAIKSGIGTGHFMAGGLPGILMNGLFVAMSVKSAVDAPKGEKFSVLMEDILAYWIGGFMLMFPLGKVVNSIAGLGEIGLKTHKDGKLIEKTITAEMLKGSDEALIKELNGKTLKEGINTLERLSIKEITETEAQIINKLLPELGKAKAGTPIEHILKEAEIKSVDSALIKELKGKTAQEAEEILAKRLKLINGCNTSTTEALLKALKNESNKGLSFKQKALKTIGRITGTGLDAPVKLADVKLAKDTGLKNAAKTALKWLRKTGPSGGLGGILRLGLVIVLTLPFQEAFKKISHTLFGKPSHPEEHEGEKTKESASTNITEPNPLVKNFFDKSSTVQPVNAQAPVAASKLPETQGSYLPSPEPAKFASQSQAAFDSALEQSSNAERKAEELLQQLTGQRPNKQ